MNDLWTQTLSAVLAGLLVLVVQARWIRGPKLPADELAETGAHTGNVARVSSKSKGPIAITQIQIDNRQTNTYIEKNISQASGESGSNDPVENVIIYGVLGFFAITLASLGFVLCFPVIRGAALGAAIAVIIMNVVAFRRSIRLAAWTDQVRTSTAGTAFAVLANVLIWRAISTTERTPLSLVTLRDTLPSFDSRPPGSGVSGFSDYVSRSVDVLLDTHDALPFVVTLLIAAVLSLAATLLAWESLLDWHAYLSFADSKNKTDRETRRAKAFVTGRGVRRLVAPALFGAAGYLAADGRLYDLYLWYIESINTTQ